MNVFNCFSFKTRKKKYERTRKLKEKLGFQILDFIVVSTIVFIELIRFLNGSKLRSHAENAI